MIHGGRSSADGFLLEAAPENPGGPSPIPILVIPMKINFSFAHEGLKKRRLEKQESSDGYR
jgi:hypothetical protein